MSESCKVIIIIPSFYQFRPLDRSVFSVMKCPADENHVLNLLKKSLSATVKFACFILQSSRLQVYQWSKNQKAAFKADSIQKPINLNLHSKMSIEVIKTWLQFSKFVWWN